jgi:cytoskeletal protein CcmA (bactofilin family)
MWKSEPDNKPKIQPGNGGGQPTPGAAPTMTRPIPAPVPTRTADHTEMAHIGKSVVIKGELSGSEDLYLDGEVEGSIELKQHRITVGPNGRVKANINASEIVILGRVDGNVNGEERVEVKRSGVLNGDIKTQRILIEDGAYFKGSVDIHRDAPKSTDSPRKGLAMAATVGSTSS